MMAGIRGRDTKPELVLRRELHARGYRFRLHRIDLPGRPDIVLPRWKVAIQVHGCFWHRHEGCKFATTPKSNAVFWEQKFAMNVERDARKLTALQEAGWRIALIWACSLSSDRRTETMADLEPWIREGNGFIELPPR
jgi:DNA mismatch endonuclease (patch repair protein)